MRAHTSQRGLYRSGRVSRRLLIETLEDRTLMAAAVAALFEPVQVNVGVNHVPVESKPDVGVAADGSFNVLFEQSAPITGSRDLYVRRFNADGTLMALNTVPVASVSDSYQHHIAVRADGSFAVTYVTDVANVLTVFFRRYAADGTPIGNPIPVAEGTSPDIAVRDADGSFAVVWLGACGVNGVCGQGFDANGNSLGPVYTITSSAGIVFSTPRVEIRPGNVPAGETALVISYGYNNVAVRRFSDLNGSAVGGVIQANIAGGTHGATVDINAAGKFVVTWGSENGASFVKFRIYDKNGVAQNADEQIVGGVGYFNTPGEETSPAVAIADNGEFIITFVESATHLSFQQYRDAGAPIVVERGFGGKGANPAISANSRGTFVMAADADVTVENVPHEPFARAFRHLPRAFFTVSSGGRLEVRQISDNDVVDTPTDFFAGAFHPYGTDYKGGISTAFGDVDYDGYDDMFVAATDAGHDVRVYVGVSFATGGGFGYFQSHFSLISGFPNGTLVAAGDVNADGISEIIISSHKGNPHVKIWDGKGFANPYYKLLASFFAYQTGFNVGASIAAGDLNGDGYAEFVTGALPGNPHVRVFDGKAVAQGTFNFDAVANPNANQLASPNFFPFGLNFNVGAYVAIGNIYGDGGNLIVGASRGNPHVKVFKNADVLNPAFNAQIDPPANSFFANPLGQDMGVAVATAPFEGDTLPDGILLGVIDGPVDWRAVKGKTNGGPIPPPPITNGDIEFEGFFGFHIGRIFVGA